MSNYYDIQDVYNMESCDIVEELNWLYNRAVVAESSLKELRRVYNGTQEDKQPSGET